MTYWLEQIAEPSIRRTTYATYEGDIRLHIIPGIGKRKLKSLQAAHIRTWLNDLRTTCQCCVQGRDDARKTARCCALSSPKCCNAVLSASSIRHILRVLRAALQDAVDEELLSRNVARLVQLRVTDERRVRSFSRDEALRFLDAARIAAGSRWRDTGLVFTTAKGGFIEPRNANRMFHDVCRKANVPQLRVHDLRHSCATLLFTMGVQPATVQRILRHSSITVTTGTYVEVIEAVQRDALDSMGSLFSVESGANASH
jgi:integrase